MHPVLFHVGSFAVHAYGAMGALAFVVGAGVVLLRGRREGLDLNRLSDVIFWTSIAGILGARAVFALQTPGAVRSLGDLLDLRSGGLVFYGGLLAGMPVGLALMRRFGLPVLATLDLWGTAFPLSHALARVGCFAAGCCYGSPWDGPLAVSYPAGSAIAPPQVPVHPVQLYEVAGLLLVALATHLYHPRRRRPGQVFLLYVLAYAAVRTVTEAFRGDLERGFFLPSLLGEALTFSQGTSLALAAAALAAFVALDRSAPPEPPTPA